MEHNIIPRSPVPTSNAAYRKNCKPTSKRPEDKTFQLDDVRMIQEHLWNPTTKDEKSVSRDGRKIPMNANVRYIFNELKKKQKSLGIKSELVFAREDGS